MTRVSIIRLDSSELETEEFDRLSNNHDQVTPRRFQWALLMFWSTYLAASAVFLSWLAGAF